MLKSQGTEVNFIRMRRITIWRQFMAGKIQDVAFEAEKTYSRTDYTALRAYLNKLSVETILHLYYDVDELAEQGIEVNPWPPAVS